MYIYCYCYNSRLINLEKIMTIKTIFIIIIISLSINYKAMAAENTQMIQCNHIVDGVQETIGTIAESSPSVAQSKCNAMIDNKHSINIATIGSKHVKTHSEYCQSQVSGTVGSGPFN